MSSNSVQQSPLLGWLNSVVLTFIASSTVLHLGFGPPPPCLFFTALGPSSISRPVVQFARLAEIVSMVLWFYVELVVFLLDHSGVKNGIRVFAPKSLSFTYRNHHAQCIHLEDVSYVVQASISLEFDWDVNHIVCGQRVSNSLEGLLNVKVLTLSSATVVLLSAASGLLGRLPTFPKLVQLYVSIVLGKHHFRALTCFVHNSPNLEFLSVNIPHRQQRWFDKECFKTENAPYECTFRQLKIVKINGFIGDEDELAFVKTRVGTSRGAQFYASFTTGTKLRTYTTKSFLQGLGVPQQLFLSLATFRTYTRSVELLQFQIEGVFSSAATSTRAALPAGGRNGRAGRVEAGYCRAVVVQAHLEAEEDRVVVALELGEVEKLGCIAVDGGDEVRAQAAEVGDIRSGRDEECVKWGDDV
ncbi:hypothetical protein Syun_018839 [Stephania yunnanensis]|uniref:FBD domain-containing protein n=1 Tax=Stephania yunnanensis TaxID=152371 RepID=A0AAP0NVD7_9MAGN